MMLIPSITVICELSRSNGDGDLDTDHGGSLGGASIERGMVVTVEPCVSGYPVSSVSCR